MLPVFAVILYLILLLLVLRIGKFRLSYFLGFFIFFSIQYGPHTFIFEQYLYINNDLRLNEKVSAYYLAAVSISYLLLIFLIAITPKPLLSCHGNSDGMSEGIKTKRNRILVPAIFMVMVSMLLPHGLEMIKEYVSFIFGSSSYSYSELRRTLFVGGIWNSYASLIRYSILPIFSASIFYLAIREISLSRKIFYLILSGAVPLLCAIQLNKLFFAYYFALYFLVYVHVKLKVVTIGLGTAFNSPLKSILLIISGAVFLFLLYWFQYSTQVSNDRSFIDQIVKTQVYRVFFAGSDGLRVWIDYFLINHQPIGIRGLGKLCNIFYSSCIDIPLLTATQYLDSDLTSIQTGLLGTGISLIGLYGIPFVIFAVYIVIIINNLVLIRLRHHEIFNIAAPMMFLNSYFLTSSQTNTALLSGGGLITPIVVLLTVATFGKKMKFQS